MDLEKHSMTSPRPPAGSQWCPTPGSPASSTSPAHTARGPEAVFTSPIMADAVRSLRPKDHAPPTLSAFAAGRCCKGQVGPMESVGTRPVQTAGRAASPLRCSPGVHLHYETPDPDTAWKHRQSVHVLIWSAQGIHYWETARLPQSNAKTFLAIAAGNEFDSVLEAALCSRQTQAHTIKSKAPAPLQGEHQLCLTFTEAVVKGCCREEAAGQ